jgi:hypothetical protein
MTSLTGPAAGKPSGSFASENIHGRCTVASWPCAVVPAAIPAVAMSTMANESDRDGRDSGGKKRLRAIGIGPPALLGTRGLLGMTADLPLR